MWQGDGNDGKRRPRQGRSRAHPLRVSLPLRFRMISLAIGVSLMPVDAAANEMFADLYGRDGAVHVEQIGVDNRADVMQAGGPSNQVILRQAGTGNRAPVPQAGGGRNRAGPGTDGSHKKS